MENPTASGVVRLVDVDVSVGQGAPRRTILDRISLEFSAGEFACVIGPSGSGKSTLLNVLAGFVSPDRGQVLLDGKETGGPGPDRGVVFQHPTLFPWLTLEQNVAFAWEAQGLRADTRDVARWLRAVGLQRSARAYPDALSGGMKQRGCIARALAGRPRVLLLDEPFSALDPQLRISMQELVTSVWEDLRTTIVFVTHDIEEAIRLGDRVVVLSASPARVLLDVRVPFSRPRAPALLFDPEFTELKRRLFEVMRAESERAFCNELQPEA
ncbi:MAG TPA: ABC transporter ATP-binding protein [Polyangiaceae bacterium]|nr:ABC transporter ATP-binding protein [Polyangiaceae bacterium]